MNALVGILCTPAVFVCSGLANSGAAAIDAPTSGAAKIAGPNACAECHKQEVEAWKSTHHFKTFQDMPRKTEANDIAKRMGLRRIKSESVCLSCHFTMQLKDGKEEPISGISCESCHSAGQDWIKVHSGYSGKKAETESKTEKEARWKLAQSKGMLRPSALYQLAKNCYSCHVVPREDLVNKGGHRAGSAFELLSWSQGEVRHNTWSNKGKDNAPASAEHKRMLYLVGLGVELETALRATGKATARKPYAFEMAMRTEQARRKIAAAAKALPGVPEINELVKLAYSTGLKLGNTASLDAAAGNISKQVIAITEKYDGSTLSGLDALMPKPDAYKGTPRAVSAVK